MNTLNIKFWKAFNGKFMLLHNKDEKSMKKSTMN